MIYAIPFTQTPVLRAGKVEEISPYLNVSLTQYTKEMPANPYDNLSKLPPHHDMNFFRLLEAFRVLSPPGKEGVGLGTGGSVLKHCGFEPRETGDLVVSDAGLHATLMACKTSLRRNGSLLVVVPDQTILSDVQLSYLFASCFSMVQIMLPSLSHADSNRVIYCTDFLENVPEWANDPPPYHFNMTSYFVTKLDEINSIFGQARFDQARCGFKDRTGEWLRKFM
jgi:hypothetical protein